MRKRIGSYGINLACVVLLYGAILLLQQVGIINSYINSILVTVGINIILAVSLNITTGFLGELSLGHAGFMAIGAYASAIFSKAVVLGPTPVELIVSLLLGGVIAGVFGFIIGIPALRLRGDYLAIITLGFGEIIRVVLENLTITGGSKGLRQIERMTNIHYVYWIMIIVVVILYAIIRSRHGRAMISIREDEIAAEASGIRTTYYKIFAFTMAAFFAGIAGGLSAHFAGVLAPSSFNFMKSIDLLVIVVLGGMGSLTGSIIAAIILSVLPEALREFADYRMLIYSLLLIVMMIFKPSGLLGTYEFSMTRLLERITKGRGRKVV